MADSDSASRSQRRTRSQAAPEWTEVEELVLVNEVAAVEADFKTEFSSFQKWTIIAENCAAQAVARGLSQYSRKWDSLLRDYCRVAEFESAPSKTSSYWSLGSHRRERLGLPVNFSDEVFSAIRSLLRARQNQPDSEPENDNVVEVARDLGAYSVASDIHIYKHAKGSRKKRQRLSPQGSWKSPFEDNVSESSAEAKIITKSRSAEEKPPQPSEFPSEKSPTENLPEKIPQSNPRGTEVEELKQGSSENGPQTDNPAEEASLDEEARERIIAQLLRQNAKRINSIVAEDVSDMESLSEDELTKYGELVRRRGTEIISCLGVIVKTLDQLCNLSPEC